jgi:transcriptional regulator with XRE-family HTH domain
MATRAPRRKTAPRSPAAAPAPLLKVPGRLAGLPMFEVARQLRSWADTVLGIAGPATDMAFGLAKANAKEPKQKQTIEKAGVMLRTMREKAGLSARDLAGALDLTNPELIAQAENGKAALPFELILRVAGVLGRDDPMTAAMRLTRAYNPGLWKALEDLGIGRLVVQAGRERELANIYRANDAARKLSDEDFARLLAFTKAGFDMAVDFGTGAKKK